MTDGGVMGGQTVDRHSAAQSENAAPGASELVYRYCSNCHAEPAPTQHRARDWPNVVRRMEAYMRSRGWSTPNNSQRQLIDEYLQKHAADAGSGSN